MGKSLSIALFALVFVLSLNAVSGFLFYSDYNVNDFKETSEFTKTTEHKTGDYWNSNSVKTTTSEKTEVRKVTRTPSYSSSYYSLKRYGYSDAPSYSNWRYKEPYISNKYQNTRYNDYYYRPRYDSQSGSYNWRW